MTSEVERIAAGLSEAQRRNETIDAIAKDLKQCGNDPVLIDYMADGARGLDIGTPVHIPGRPFCKGYVAYGVTDCLQVNVTSTLDNMSGAIFSAPASSLAVRQQLMKENSDG